MHLIHMSVCQQAVYADACITLLALVLVPCNLFLHWQNMTFHAIPPPNMHVYMDIMYMYCAQVLNDIRKSVASEVNDMCGNIPYQGGMLYQFSEKNT